MYRTEIHENDMHSFSKMCNTLYLTPPGKLWSNHPDSTDPDAFQRRVAEEVRHHLAIHTPRNSYTQLHSWRTWGLWVDGYTPSQTEATSSMRVEWQPPNETFANTRTDSLFDEYLKTSDVPLRGHRHTFQRAHKIVLKRIRERVTHQQELASTKQKTIDRLTTVGRLFFVNRRSHSPFDTLHLVTQFGASKAKTVAQSAYATVGTSFQTNATGQRLPMYYDPAPHPLRLDALQFHTTLPSPTVCHPFNQAAALLERLERTLEAKYTATHVLKASEYKALVGTIVHFARQIVTRGQSALDFRQQCEESLDLLEVAPSFDNFMKRKVFHYSTLHSLPSDLYQNIEMLFGSSAKHMKNAMTLIRMLHPNWDKVEATEATNVMDVSLLHKLLTNIEPSHANETVRKTYVTKVLSDTNLIGKQTLYTNRYEQLVRAKYMSDSAFRKDQTTLATAFSLLQVPRQRTKPAVHAAITRRKHTPVEPLLQPKAHVGVVHPQPPKAHVGVVHPQPPKAHVGVVHPQPPKALSKKDLSTKTKTLAIKLNATDRVPQHVDVRQKKVRSRSLTKMSTSPAKVNISKVPTTPNVRLPTTTTPPTQTGGARKNQNSPMKSRTITLMTSANKASSKREPKKQTALIRITKGKPVNLIARYLTTRDVETYRSGLHKYIKQKGGDGFVAQLKQSQHKQTPHFEFGDIVPTSSARYESIQKKLKLSAKNRNALRRVKRSVLRNYGGGNHTVKNSSPEPPPLTTTSPVQTDATESGRVPEFTGSLFTRKNAGGQSTTAPRVTWNAKDSLGDNLRDTSHSDLKNTEGVTNIDLTSLSSLETVDL